MPKKLALPRSALVAAGRPRGLTHGLFRFPAKMHPPLVRTLLRRYTKAGDAVHDPFVGSGTLIVEAIALGRRASGADIDPLAVFVAKAKTTKYDCEKLEATFARLQERLAKARRPKEDIIKRDRKDLSGHHTSRVLRSLGFPEIPNRDHWFNRYVVVDLARLFHLVRTTRMARAERDFFTACALAIVRTVSRADPIPSSGLEVTKRMRELETKGRAIDVLAQFERHTKRHLKGARELAEALDDTTRAPRLLVADVRRGNLRARHLGSGRKFKCIITSPPYIGAIEYLRRHRLERYLQTGKNGEQLNRAYIGRRFHVDLNGAHNTADLDDYNWYRRLEKRDEGSAQATLAYFSELGRVLRRLRHLLRNDGRLILLVGDVRLKKVRIPIGLTIADLLRDHYKLTAWRTYPLRNRYMSYARHNGDGVAHETVLVLKPRHQVVRRKRPRTQADRRGRRGNGRRAG